MTHEQMNGVYFELEDVSVVSKKNKMRTSRGRIYKDKSVILFEEELKRALDVYVVQMAHVPYPKGVELCARITVRVPDKRVRDIQNFQDTVLDCCNGALFWDDSQICHLEMNRVQGGAWGLRIELWEIGESPKW